MISHESSVKRTISPLCVLILLTSFSEGYSRERFKVASIADSAPATASLAGTVVDENDAVVPEASVEVKDTGASIRKEVRTSPVGLFTITELPPGRYTLAVQHAGFATSEVKGLSLKVNERLALKIRLKVGPVGETITIDADTSIVQRSPAVSTSLSRQMIENL